MHSQAGRKYSRPSHWAAHGPFCQSGIHLHAAPRRLLHLEGSEAVNTSQDLVGLLNELGILQPEYWPVLWAGNLARKQEELAHIPMPREEFLEPGQCYPRRATIYRSWKPSAVSIEFTF